MSPTKTLRLHDLKLPLDLVTPESEAPLLRAAGLKALHIQDADLLHLHVHKRGYDVRKKSDIHFIYTLDVTVPSGLHNKAVDALQATPDMAYRLPAGKAHASRPVVIGTGPCGLFAALILAQTGLKPLVLERGRTVRERTKDTWGLWRKSTLDVNSNVQFGEGGAGTFSDGKLYSQVKDPRFLSRKVLEEMVKGGAPEEILYVSKPHIGTFRLVKVVDYLRSEITRLGGEIRFETKVVDLQINTSANNERSVVGVTIQQVMSGETTQIDAQHVVLAIGHSARDTFEMLQTQGVYMVAKPFSVGFRIEHPQGWIDRARYGVGNGLPERVTSKVGAADYKLVHHAKNGRSVYSFCMCPGGTVVAATSEAGRVVTNGMSQYSRNERNANAGIVVGIEPADFDLDMNGKPLVADKEQGQLLAGVRFQRALEAHAYVLGDSNYQAPAQRVGDFLAGRASTAAGEVSPSYKPGVKWTDLTGTGGLSPALPRYAIAAIQEALPAFGKQIKGFDAFDAVLTGVETRTSSPVRIQRNPDSHLNSMQSVNTAGLYPAGEGAGYAGGIMSAAMDGIKVAEQIVKAYI